jgi:hypothetical protein
MTTNAPFLSANGWLGIIPEVTRGTTPASGTVQYIPTMDPHISPMLTWLNDPALRGSPVENYDQVPATRHDEVDFKCYLYNDTFPIILRGILGSTDTVSGSYVHTIGLLNNAATGSQPPSYSICLFDAADAYVISGSQADQLDLSFGASTAVEATMKYKGNPWTTPTTSPAAPFTSPAFGAIVLAPAWDTTVSIAASQDYNVQDGKLSIVRKADPIFTMGQQGPNPVFAGTCEVKGSLTIVVNSASDVFSTGAGPTALVRNQQAMVVTFNDPNSGVATSLALTMSKTQFENVKRSQSKSFVELSVDFVAVANATDAISGYSPIKTVTTNAVSSAY